MLLSKQRGVMACNRCGGTLIDVQGIVVCEECGEIEPT